MQILKLLHGRLSITLREKERGVTHFIILILFAVELEEGKVAPELEDSLGQEPTRMAQPS